MRRSLLCLALMLPVAPALAQEAPSTGSNAEGDYGGVHPGQPRKPDPGKKPRRPPPKGTLAWIGFEAKDGGAEVFLQSAAAFEVSQRLDGGVLVVTLNGVSRLGANTSRPIDTRFFETALARITARKKGRGIEVRVAFKNPKEATQGTVRTSVDTDGTYFVHLTFPGAAPAATEVSKPAS